MIVVARIRVYVTGCDCTANTSVQPKYTCSGKTYGFILEKKAGAIFMNMKKHFL
jgi:hypothetical protein